MNRLNAKTVAAIVASALAVGTGTYLVQQGEVNRLCKENDNLIARQEQIAAERNTALSAANANREELERLRKNEIDLLRLRAEVGKLRQQTNDLAALLEENRQLRSAMSAARSDEANKTPPEVPPEDIFPRESWRFAGFATPEATLQTLQWAAVNAEFDTVASCVVSPKERTEIQRYPAKEFPGKSRSEIIAYYKEREDQEREHNVTGYRIIKRDKVSETEVVLVFHFDGPNIYRHMKCEKVGDEWKISPGQVR